MSLKFDSERGVLMAKKIRRKSKEAARRHRDEEKSKNFVKLLVAIGAVVVLAFVLLRVFVA
jgi:uncharacterized membrane protein YidH (DUF202 family)